MKDYRLPRTKKGRSVRQSRSSTSDSAVISGFKKFFLKLFLFCLVLALLAGSIFFVVFKVIYPRVADLELSTTIVFVPSINDLTDKKLLIAQYDAKKQAMTVVNLSTDEEVEVIGGFGKYPLKSMYPLLKLDKKDDAFILAAYSSVLGQVVDGVIETDQELGISSMPQLINLISRDLLTHPLGLWTNTSQVQLMSVAGQLTQNEFQHRAMNSLPEWQEYATKQAMAQPDASCPVAVVNTTTVSGLATSISGVVEGSSYTVIRVANTSSPLAQSQIVVDPAAPECFKHAQRLQNVLPVKIEVIQDGEQTSTYRSKIIIFIGEDVSHIWGS